MMISYSKENFTFTKFNSKELQRAFRELTGSPFITFITLNRLILQFNCNKNFRSISYENLLKEIPIKMSLRTLKTCVQILLGKNFIKKFINTDTGENVYSLVSPPKNPGYSKIDNFVLTQIAGLTNEFNFKLYLLIFSGITHFNKQTFRKYFSDFINLLGLTDTRNNRNKIKKGIQNLRSLSLIAVNEFQRFKLDRKRFSIKISFFWKDVQNNATESAKNKVGKCKNLQTYKKENNTKNKIYSNSIFSLPNWAKPESSTTEQNKTKVFDLNINFYGFDKFENPLTVWSVKNVLANNSNLTLDQVKRSIKRFSSYFNSPYRNKEISDPVAFLVTHLINYGEYIPPETFLQNQHKIKKNENFMETFKSYFGLKVLEKNPCSPPKTIPINLREKYISKARQEILNFSQNSRVVSNDKIVFQRALNLYKKDNI